MTIPLFKSHYSIGKSILTLASPEKSSEDGKGSDSIFDLAIEGGLKEIFLIEDSLVGFLQAQKTCEKLDLNLRFGLRLNIVDSLEAEDQSCMHKIVIFAQNAEGCKILNKIYSFAFTGGEGKIDNKKLFEYWCDDSLKLAIPFYDSFIFENLFKFSSCIPDFSFTDPFYFVEDNGLPFDSVLQEKVKFYCKTPIKTKSIYYKNKKDFEAFQTYKCLCARQFYKKATLENPNLDHCGSPEFSFESWRAINER
tara:strand:+ start:8194 stop:8946 length:753 start_codon:yes stop_codon:yes gene_type:complete